LTLQGETNKNLFAAKNISKQGLDLGSTGLKTRFYVAVIPNYSVLEALSSGVRLLGPNTYHSALSSAES